MLDFLRLLAELVKKQLTRINKNMTRVIEDCFYPFESKLKADHDALQFQPVRIYRLHPISQAYVKDIRTKKVIEGCDNVSRILNGELDLIIE